MASLTDINVGDVVTIRIYKRWATNPDLIWANNYEFESVASGQDSESVRELVEGVAQAEAEIHTGFVIFDRGVASTYEEDSEPYDPDTFVVQDLSQLVGQRNISGAQPLDVRSVLFARFSATTGRPGRRYYRGVLSEDDVNATSTGRYANLSPASQVLLDAPLSFLLQQPAGTSNWRLVLASTIAGVLRSRPVANIRASQVTSRQLRRRTTRKFGDIGGAPAA